MDKFLSKIKIKTGFKKYQPLKKLDPHKHWNALLIIFFVFVITLIIFSLYLLFKIKDQQIFQAVPEENIQPSLINEKLLNEINNSFELKSLKEQEIKSGLIRYTDPS